MTDYGAEAVRIANEMNEILKGKPAVSVYLAIGMTLGAMEAEAERPDRKRMLALLSGVMDDYSNQGEKR